MPLPRQWKRRLVIVAAVLAAPALVFLTFDALVAGGNVSTDRPVLVETFGRASRAAGEMVRGSGERLRGDGGTTVPPPAPPPAPLPQPESRPADPTLVAAAERVTVPILVYHNIAVPGPKARPGDLAYYVTPDQFESQMAYLETRGFAAVSPDDIDAALRGTKALPSKPVAITLDDDRESQFQNALPSLTRHHLTATFYVFTNAIGRKGYFTWDQLRTLRDAGMTIGSHSIFHPFLGMLDEEALRKEVADSKAVLEKELGISVTSFAYPFGTHDDRVVAAVRAAGYAAARSLRHTVVIGGADVFLLPGYVVTGDPARFASILAGTAR